MRKMMMGVISLMEGMGRPLETPSHNRESVSKYATTGMHLLKLLSVEQIQEAVIRSFSMYLTEAKELVRVLQNEKKGDVVSVGDHPLLSYRKVLPGGQSHVPECLSMRAIVSLEKIELVLRSFFSHPNDFYMELSHVEKRRRNGIVHDCNMDVGCLNPALAFQDLSDQSHSIMLASGTLSPMNTFGSELGCVFPKKLEARHVIQKDQVECMCIPKGVKGSSLTSSFRAGGDLAMTTDLGETLVGLTRVIPHGMLFFFPSFQKLETTLSRWMESGLWNRIEEHKEIFSEPRHARSLDKVIRGYEERVDHSVKGESRGAILFAVFRGKISEGIDFSDAKARGE
uniref:ATP-dependent helicase C-terminal domain-containing protein n=1 Tax=Palpitomonas bilix TaxID=652834 RepID=A0A7S3GJB6_9EUKA|mmetsp:Transcript_5971/g.14344  ORF Transcript_5971/g.14344 Transcript_5971/m.14344 type:complete len:341 (+) Transcript_5971:2693-3715(+)